MKFLTMRHRYGLSRAVMMLHPGNVLSWVGHDFEEPDLVNCVPAHGRELGNR